MGSDDGFGVDGSPVPELRGGWAEFGRLLVVGVSARLTGLVALDSLQRERATESVADAVRLRREAADAEARLHWNATTLVYTYGVVEGQIEALGPLLRPAMEKAILESRVDLRRKVSEVNGRLRREGHSEDTIALLKRLGEDVLTRLLPRVPAARLDRQLLPVERWEDALGRVWLGEPKERPLPDDLRSTLNELGEVRNVLLHRLGRLDEKALRSIQEGPWRDEGDVVVVDNELYRRYIAALFSFAEEMHDRLRLRFGLAARCDLAGWRKQYPVGG